MKKRGAILCLAGLLLAGVLAASAAGGAATDPLISKAYLDGTYAAQAVTQADARIAQRHEAIYQAAEIRLRAPAGAVQPVAGTYNAAFADGRFKRGDVLRVSTGSGFRLLAGTAVAAYSGGAVVDVTAGAVLPAGPLAAGRHYLAAEHTVVAVSVTSPTAVLSLEGEYTLVPSGETDYNALAEALKTLGLFLGSDTGYGGGYDLELAPTRIQGLIMFLRLMGEERAALASTAQIPFHDVPAWCRPYVAYAYQKGYTKGLDAQRFGTNQTMGAADYVTFLLRALGYAEGTDFTWATALDSAQGLGVLTAGERQILGKETFLRAHVAYLSYFALDAAYQGGGKTLQSVLVSAGLFDQVTANTVRGSVVVKRLP